MLNMWNWFRWPMHKLGIRYCQKIPALTDLNYIKYLTSITCQISQLKIADATLLILVGTNFHLKVACKPQTIKNELM